MPRKQKKKYHYLYKTTNLINKNYYIGVHSTYEIKDGYLGSGKKLWNSIYKYGKENFVKEELEFFESREELLQREKEIVNEELINDPLCMNLKPGGIGGFSSEEHRLKCQKAGHNAVIKSGKSFEKIKKLKKDKQSDWYLNFFNNMSNAKKGNKNWVGKKHSKESILKMKKSKNVGKENSQYGTCWINNGKEVKKIKKENLNNWLQNNWKLGRKINNREL